MAESRLNRAEQRTLLRNAFASPLLLWARACTALRRKWKRSGCRCPRCPRCQREREGTRLGGPRVPLTRRISCSQRAALKTQRARGDSCAWVRPSPGAPPGRLAAILVRTSAGGESRRGNEKGERREGDRQLTRKKEERKEDATRACLPRASCARSVSSFCVALFCRASLGTTRHTATAKERRAGDATSSHEHTNTRRRTRTPR